MENNSQTREPEVVLFPEKIIISCVTKKKGPLTKIMKLDPETKALVKDSSECSMWDGSIAQVGISSPAGFAKMLRSRAQNQAIVHGIYHDHKTAKVLKTSMLPSTPRNGEPVIARSTKYIKYPDAPGVLLFDHDKARDTSVGSEQALKSYSPAELIAILATVHQDIAKAAYVSTPSTSACIYDSEGNLLRGEGTGSHVYLFVKKASDIPRYLKTLGKRLFLAGLGRVEISTSGSLLKRTLVDLLVGSPERLDFVAGAECRDGLVQKLPDPIVKNGDLLDTELLPELNPTEESAYNEIIKELSKTAQPTRERVNAEYLETQSAKLVSDKISFDEAKKIIISRQNHILEDEDILFFAHLEAGVTVASVLLDGEGFHGRSLADPCEPDYEGGSKTKARFYWNEGSPLIRSFAHGENIYKFRQFEKAKSNYPQETNEALTKMNKEYAAVLLGGDFRIAKEGFDHAARKHTLSFLKTTSLYMYYANTRVRVPVGPEGDIEYKELAKVWIGWEGRRTYDDVVFDPSGQNRPNVYNLFKGFPLKPKQGDWSLMRNHIFQVICDGNAEHFAYVMAWMARAVQDPGGDKPGVAIVLKGGKGIGKGVFVNYFGSIFGEAFLPISDSESFTGRFNMHLSKSLVVFLDEAVWGGDKKAEGKLKQLITEPTVLFEPKGIDSIALSNFINIIIASNEEWVVPATGDERRFCVLEPSEAFKQDTQYFGQIAKERKNGGAEAMMYDLLQYDISTVDLRRAPMTEGLSQQVQQSLPSVLEFWHSVINREFLLSDRETGRPRKTELDEGIAPIDELWPGAVFKHEIYAEFIQWCKIKNERYIKNETHFWRTTRNIWPGGEPVEKRSSERIGRVRFYVLPELTEFRTSFSRRTNISFDNPTQENNGLTPWNNQF